MPLPENEGGNLTEGDSMPNADGWPIPLPSSLLYEHRRAKRWTALKIEHQSQGHGQESKPCELPYRLLARGLGTGLLVLLAHDVLVVCPIASTPAGS